jgi:hypothetical protein
MLTEWSYRAIALKLVHVVAILLLRAGWRLYHEKGCLSKLREAAGRSDNMQPAESPFPSYWWGTSLEIAGLGDVRPRVLTYGRYEFSALPPVPFAMRGELDWLVVAPVHHPNVGVVKPAENVRAMEELQQAADWLWPHMPAAFVKFFKNPSLWQHIRSNTHCFLDLCPAPVRSPIGGGYLIRFLADSQACLYWYLYLAHDGLDHAVVATPGFYGTEEEPWRDEKEGNPADIVFCAESFEVFLWRFWLENQIWFAAYEKTPQSDAGIAYIEQYRRNR